MLSSVIKPYAKWSGFPKSTVEKIWNQITECAKKKGMPEDDAFWKYVSGTTKKRLMAMNPELKEANNSLDKFKSLLKEGDKNEN